jgi:hypothetical protein
MPVSDGKCYFWYSYPIEDGVSASWSGGCRDGLLSGAGTLTWSVSYGRKPGNRVETVYRDGSRNGHAAILEPNGDHKEMEYRDNMVNGHAVEFYHDGTRFEGEYRDDRRNGHGTITWPNGNRFDGEFVDGSANGPGILVWGREAFNGIWRNGCFKDGARRASAGKELSACP